MMGGNYNQSAQRPAFGIQDQMVANTQQGVPLPYIAGTRKVAATWISPVYNLKATPSSGGGKKGGGKGGKGGGGGATGTYNYFGTVAGALCMGPVDGLRAIILNGQEVWPGGKAWVNGQTMISGGLYVYDAQTWVALSTHVASPANAPGNVTYWTQYVFSPTTETFDDIVIPVQGSATSGKSKGAVGGPSTYGSLRFYWGKAGQGQDTHLAAGGNNLGDDHPAYQGICYIVLMDFWLGSGTTTAPNLEFVLRRKPQQTVITGSPAAINDGQACMAAVAAEVFTDQNLLGLQSALLDATSWQAAANVLDAQKLLTAGSVLIDTQDTIRSFLSRLTEMTDNFVRFNPSTGLIEMGVYRHGVSPGAGTYSTLNSAALTERPKLTNGGWSEVKSRAVVRFPDRTLAYQDNTEKADDPRAFFVLQEHRSVNLDRPFICRASQAIAHGAETLRTVGRPVMSGEVSVRRELGRTIRAGDYVLLDVDIEPNVTTLYEFFRVTQRTIPQSGPIKLMLAGDNTLSPVPWTNSLPPIVQSQSEVPPLTNIRIVESPYGLSNSSGKVLALAQRPNGLITGFHLYWDTTDGTGGIAYVTLGGQTTFAAKATLSADVSADQLAVAVLVPDQEDADLFTITPGDLASKNNELLLFLVSVVPAGTAMAGQVAQDTLGYALMEVLSVSGSTMLGAGFYALGVLRGRLGTTPQGFIAANTEVWVVPRSSLIEYEHSQFAGQVIFTPGGYNQSTSYFRTTPYTYIAELLLSDATAIPFVFPPRSIAAPVLSLTAPSSNPFTVSGVTYPHAVAVTGTWQSDNDNLVSWKVTLQKSTDASPRVLASAAFAPTDAAAFNLNATLESGGSYVLTLQAHDANGVGTTETVNITATGSGAKAATPVWDFLGNELSQSTSEVTAKANPNYGCVGLLGLSCPTPGSSIFWEWGQWNATFGHIDWSTVSSGGALTVVNYATSKPLRLMLNSSGSPLGDFYFRAYATASGMANSDKMVVRFLDELNTSTSNLR